MPKELPARPSLEHLKSQAKDLLDAYRNGDREALRRFRESLPSAHGADDARLARMGLALHDAQSVIAREYGLESWNALRAHVEARTKTPSPELLRALMQRHMTSPIPDELLAALRSAAQVRATTGDLALPPTLPVVPTRNALLTAGAVAPFQIGRASSIAAIDAARAGSGVLAMFAQKSEANESPGAEDLHAVGCAARLLKVVPAEGHGLWIVVRAARWIRLDSLEATSPYLVARIAPFAVNEEESDAITRLHRDLEGRVRASLAAMPDGARMASAIDGMTPLQLADAAIANLPCSVDDKARYAELTSVEERLVCVLALLAKSAA